MHKGKIFQVSTALDKETFLPRCSKADHVRNRRADNQMHKGKPPRVHKFHKKPPHQNKPIVSPILASSTPVDPWNGAHDQCTKKNNRCVETTNSSTIFSVLDRMTWASCTKRIKRGTAELSIVEVVRSVWQEFHGDNKYSGPKTENVLAWCWCCTDYWLGCRRPVWWMLRNYSC